MICGFRPEKVGRIFRRSGAETTEAQGASSYQTKVYTDIHHFIDIPNGHLWV